MAQTNNDQEIDTYHTIHIIDTYKTECRSLKHKITFKKKNTF